MSLLNDIPLTALNFYLAAPYPCSYLPDLQARSQVATPALLISTPVYSELVQHGFRRSGTYTYRPHCDNCRACVPLRILAKQFTANRSQRRAWKQHAHLEATLHPLQDNAEYYDLYQRYQRARHKDGGMDNDDRESYQNFLLQSHVDSLLVEFREPFDRATSTTPLVLSRIEGSGQADGTTDMTTSHLTNPAKDAGQVIGYSHSTKPANGQVAGYQDRQGALRMVSVIDLLSDGLSSVYTFYEPDLPHARLGVYNVLWQIELCRKLDLDFVYLGYWIEASRKMAYKTQYQPAQGLLDGTWRTLDRPVPSPVEGPVLSPSDASTSSAQGTQSVSKPVLSVVEGDEGESA